MTRRWAGLPEFPWDLLTDARDTAAAHPDGLVDLSVGTPVDPVPPFVQAALAGPAAAAPGYPLAAGSTDLRAAAAESMARRFGLPGIDPVTVLPTIGSKELVAWLPVLLELGPGDVVAIPELCYPTYEVGARLVGAEVVRLADGAAPPPRTRLVWLNSPSNPTGRVLPADEMRAAVDAARSVGAVLASDECYLALDGPAGSAVSVLHPSVCDGVIDGLLAVHSLSKSSNLAGYRAAFVVGDPELVADLLAVRRHIGMIMPRPVQAAMTAALSEDGHVAAQAARYDTRRDRLRDAVKAFGLRVEHSAAGIYVWASAGESCWDTVAAFAARGILVAPGTFYGPAGSQHVRLALTATDQDIDAAALRLTG